MLSSIWDQRGRMLPTGVPFQWKGTRWSGCVAGTWREIIAHRVGSTKPNCRGFSRRLRLSDGVASSPADAQKAIRPFGWCVGAFAPAIPAFCLPSSYVHYLPASDLAAACPPACICVNATPGQTSLIKVGCSTSIGRCLFI
jgi:hypothetical protein